MIRFFGSLIRLQLEACWGLGELGLSPGWLSPSKIRDQISSHGGSNVLRGAGPNGEVLFKPLHLSYLLMPSSPKEVTRPSPGSIQERLHRGMGTKSHDSLSTFTIMIYPRW